MQGPHPRGGRIDLGRRAESEGGDVLDGALQPVPRLVAKARGCLHDGHRLGMQGLQQQGTQPADHGQRLGVHPPGHTAGSEVAEIVHHR